MRRRIDGLNPSFRRHVRRRDVGPRLSTVTGHLDEAVVGTGPDHAGLDGRPVRFVAAVRAALDDATWITRWLEGESIPDELVDQDTAEEWSSNDYGPLAMSEDIIARFGPLPG